MVPTRLKAATATHDVIVWFCGLGSADQHIARARARANLIALMPDIAYLRVFDNSTEAPPGTPVPDPLPVLEMQQGRLLWPTDSADLRNTPDWAKPLLEAALPSPVPTGR